MKRRLTAKSGFDLIEEATHLLRSARPGVWAAYYLGAVPFILGLLFFWADMSRSPFAGQHVADSALGVAALFYWMKFWQAIFARKLRAQFTGEPERWTGRRYVRLAVTQTFLQSWSLVPMGLLALATFAFPPLILLLAAPVGWMLILFQNVTVLADGETADTRAILRRAWRLWWWSPVQGWLVFLVLGGFGFYVFLNWTVVCLTLPHLIKMLAGVESVFARDTLSLLNSTFLAGMAGLTYLCLDPILKSVCLLRCFYGESQETGEDLRAELNSFATAAPLRAVLVASLMFAGLTSAFAAGTSSPAPPPAVPAVSPADLDQSINRTIHETKYTWRMPREQVTDANAKDGAIMQFLEKVGTMLRHWARAVVDWLEKWWRKLHPPRPSVSLPKVSGYGWIMALQVLLYGLVAVAAAALAILIYRTWRHRRTPPIATSEPIQPVPDLADENVPADQLPEDGWIRLGRELLERGELRLALRAFYLASLSHLAARNLISIARFKSNREYQRELQRRAHSFPDLLTVFAENLQSFECIWYGAHAVNRELADRFAANVERMKTAG